MWKHHPETPDFESLFRGVSGPESASRNAWTMSHILTFCSTCREHLTTTGWNAERLGRLVDFSATRAKREDNASGPDYSAAFAGAAEALNALFAPEAPLDHSPETLLAEIDRISGDQGRDRIDQDSRFAHPEVVRGLIERSHMLRYEAPERMLHYALLAKTAAEACQPFAAGSPERLADLRARGWLQYANSLRVCGRLHDADDALEEAQRFRRAGTRDPLLRARIQEQAASLRYFQGRFQEAIGLAREAGLVYRELDEKHGLSSTMVQTAIASLYAGDSEYAVRTLNRAIPLIDAEENPQLLLAACHNLIRAYIDLDCPEQALSLYYETRDLYRAFGENATILLRTGWQEGQILRDLGHLNAAEAALRRVRQGFQERGLGYEVALVSLDLAGVYVRLGKVEDVRRTATEALPIFSSLGVEREALGALLQLQQAAGQEQQALELIRTLSAHLAPLAQGNTSR